MNKFETKTQQVAQHLVEKESITSWEAILLYRATRLSGIIYNLKKQGYIIETENIYEDGTHYAKYHFKGFENDEIS